MLQLLLSSRTPRGEVFPAHLLLRSCAGRPLPVSRPPQGLDAEGLSLLTPVGVSRERPKVKPGGGQSTKGLSGQRSFLANPPGGEYKESPKAEPTLGGDVFRHFGSELL